MLSNLTDDMFKKGLVVQFSLSFESKKSDMVVYEHTIPEKVLTSVFGRRMHGQAVVHSRRPCCQADTRKRSARLYPPEGGKEKLLSLTVCWSNW